MKLALSFIIEKAIFTLDEVKGVNKHLEIIIEKRGNKEDKKLEEHFQGLIARRKGFFSVERLQEVQLKNTFKDKKENINGLQLADLMAYSMACYVIVSNLVNLAFDKFEPKIYKKNGKRYGLKIFP